MSDDLFWNRVDTAGICWEWRGSRSRAGYGLHNRSRTQHIGAHRHAWELLVGPLGDLQLDHLCKNTSCVNPDHLEPVTGHENNRRSYSPTGKNARKTHCPQGHLYDESNTYLHRGSRYCISCQRARNRQQVHKPCPTCGKYMNPTSISKHRQKLHNEAPVPNGHHVRAVGAAS